MHRNKFFVLGMLMVGLALSGCGQALQLGGKGSPSAPTPGLARATPGTEKGATDAAAGPSIVAGAPETTAAPEVAQTAAPAAAPQTNEAPPPPPGGTPTVNPALANVQLPTAADLQGRWRQMQVDRVTFDKPQPYTSPGYQFVWWFDPIFGQLVPIGQLRGEFTAQATFRIRGHWNSALEIPYHVNQQYGFTVPEPIVQRMKNAGAGEWAEVFVYQTQDMQAR